MVPWYSFRYSDFWMGLNHPTLLSREQLASTNSKAKQAQVGRVIDTYSITLLFISLLFPYSFPIHLLIYFL